MLQINRLLICLTCIPFTGGWNLAVSARFHPQGMVTCHYFFLFFVTGVKVAAFFGPVLLTKSPCWAKGTPWQCFSLHNNRICGWNGSKQIMHVCLRTPHFLYNSGQVSEGGTEIFEWVNKVSVLQTVYFHFQSNWMHVYRVKHPHHNLLLKHTDTSFLSLTCLYYSENIIVSECSEPPLLSPSPSICFLSFPTPTGTLGV